MKVAVSCSLMKNLDQNTIQNKGIPSLVLMERAALKTVDEIEKRLSENKKKEKILCICGSGNNGGDGIAIARILRLHGYDAYIYLAGNPAHMTVETAQQSEIASQYQVPVVSEFQPDGYTVIVDALFGIGLVRDITGAYAELLNQVNHTEAWKVAVDIPSGINGDTGEVMGIAFQANLTVTFAFRKKGLCLYPGRKYAGELVVADIGIYEEPALMEPAYYYEKSDIGLLPPRNPEGNKGTFGKVLAVAGSAGMCGAAYFCGAAALAAGAGMVKIFTEEANRIPLQTAFPEAMIEWRENEESFQRSFDWCDVLIIGPGLGTSENSRKKAAWFLKKAYAEKKNVILDADGLNLLSGEPEWRQYLGSHVILTPHMGEMSRLTAVSIPELVRDRAAAAKALAEETGAVCVLKDSSTVTASPQGELWYNLSGNPGMAAAGSGDVLAGVLAGMFCMHLDKKLSTKEMAGTAALGVYLHGVAGDLAAEEKGQYGMKAGDLIPAVSRAVGLGGKYEKI